MLRNHQLLAHNLMGLSRAISTTILLFQNIVACPSLMMLMVAKASKGSPTSSLVSLLPGVHHAGLRPGLLWHHGHASFGVHHGVVQVEAGRHAVAADLGGQVRLPADAV